MMGLFGSGKKREGPQHAEVSAQLLNDDGRVDVVSEDRFQPALAAIVEGKTGGGRDVEVVAVLLAAPGVRDPYEHSRIQVQVDGRKVGYFSPEDAKLYKPVMKELLKDNLAGVCIANVRGGNRLTSGEENRYRVVLHLAPAPLALDDPPQEVHDHFDRLMSGQEAVES